MHLSCSVCGVSINAIFSLEAYQLRGSNVPYEHVPDEQTVTVSRLSEACYGGALSIPDGQIFSGVGTTRVFSPVSIDTEKPAVQGVMVEPPHQLILNAPIVEFNPLFDVQQHNVLGGATLQVMIEQVNCP